MTEVEGFIGEEDHSTPMFKISTMLVLYYVFLVVAIYTLKLLIKHNVDVNWGRPLRVDTFAILQCKVGSFLWPKLCFPMVLT